MKSTPHKAMVYRRGMINGAPKDYFDEKKRKGRMTHERNRLIALGIAGISLIVMALFLLKIFGGL